MDLSPTPSIDNEVTITVSLKDFMAKLADHNKDHEDEHGPLALIGATYYPVVYLLRNGGTSPALNNGYVKENGEIVEPAFVFEVQG